MAVISCLNEKMAQKIIKTYDGSEDIYGKKYVLHIRDYNDIYLM